ncbi:uncharacterized protein HMPREF1541_05974 [Cyphellophora europaea CBS 101466]|uniref:Prion-inhibition and propagation HeLo domain-containing protein n=1 Tax=Cyphellophora europaea (strain CBS 101466) TaxID=1220924 RepID=W2RVE4_CYPE1|nr:uncharacterized protein HMPREF1541_05974 [Cyphellophora europaea CBS 101466]ETN39748.1 hypothetical protein HMPREF1541_05974 [Cyphellophora europaea CBS 101466]
MAEVTGLVVGTIGLAALFQTCVELFDCFELGRNYASDYQLACTKLDLLQARLSHWGGVLSVDLPGCEHPALRQNWPDEQHVIARSLNGIKDIFRNATILAEKYKSSARRVKIPSIRSLQKQESAAAIGEPAQLIRLSRWSLIGKRTLWAIHDKSKFDGFIDDLRFLIENLEKVQIRITMSGSRSTAQRKPTPKATMTEEPARGRSGDRGSTSHATPPPKTQAKTAGKPSPKDDIKRPIEPVGRNCGHATVDNDFTNNNHFDVYGNVGDLGEKAKKHLFRNNTFKNTGGFSLHGDAASGKDLAEVLRCYMTSSDAADRDSEASTETYSSDETIQAPLSRGSLRRGQN